MSQPAEQQSEVDSDILKRMYTSMRKLQPGPCVVCGLENYPLSMGGPAICPACDCGIAVTDLRHPMNIMSQHQNQPAQGPRGLGDPPYGESNFESDTRRQLSETQQLLAALNGHLADFSLPTLAALARIEKRLEMANDQLAATVTALNALTQATLAILTNVDPGLKPNPQPTAQTQA